MKQNKDVAPSPFRRSLNRLRRRRPRSAPPGPRTPLIEHHFHFDKERKEVLPGAPKHDSDLARDSHDFFNLVVLIPIVALNVMNWDWDKLFNHIGGNVKKKERLLDSWTGEWFDAFFYACALYFVVDLIWIMVIPRCVKSPSTIIQHHIFTMVYILIPYLRHDRRWAMGAYMSVEINTWFLIARRVFNKEGFPPWIIDLSVVSIRIKLISICFYLTWIGIRCILYPALLIQLYKLWRIESENVNSFVNIEVVQPLMQSAFCILNFKWTFDLIRSKYRYCRRRRRSG
eukprot:scaffold1062_cov130-Cylindrotheca_fusiformis.AAC.36